MAGKQPNQGDVDQARPHVLLGTTSKLPSNRFRVLFFGTLGVVTATVIAVAGKLVAYPLWQEYRATRDLLEYVRSDDYPQGIFHGEAIGALRDAYGDDRLVIAACSLLTHSDSVVRARAVSILAMGERYASRFFLEPQGDEAQRELHSALLFAVHDPCPSVRLEVLYTLASRYGSQAVPQLTEALNDVDPDVKDSVAHLLQQIADDLETD